MQRFGFVFLLALSLGACANYDRFAGPQSQLDAAPAVSDSGRCLPETEPYQIGRQDPRFTPTVVDRPDIPAGTIVIETSECHLYYGLNGRQAIRYGIGVGKQGFAWNGTEVISAKREWPDWHPPAEMRLRRPDLPAMMSGGIENPLGARALYLGSTLYRIHGSNQPETIGRAVSSGCIRMTNDDIVDLFNRVRVGTKVTVL